MKHIGLFGLWLFFIILRPVWGIENSCILRIASLSHFTSPYSIGPILKKTFQKKYQCKIEYITYRNFTHLMRSLPYLLEHKTVDAVIGLLSTDFEFLNDNRLTAHHNYAYSPISIIYNKNLGRNFQSLKNLLAQNVTILAPHPETSQVGRAWELWTTSLHTHIKAKIQYYPSWDLAYKAFLHHESAYVVSYATSEYYHLKFTKDNQYKAMSFTEGHPLHYYAFAGVKGSSHEKMVQQFFRLLISPSTQTLIPEKYIMYPVSDLKKSHPLNNIAKPAKILNFGNPEPLHISLQSFWGELPKILLHTLFLGTFVTGLSLILGIFLGTGLFFISHYNSPKKIIRFVPSLAHSFLSLVYVIPSVITYSALKAFLSSQTGFSWIIYSLVWVTTTSLAVLTYGVLQSLPEHWVYLTNAYKLSIKQMLKAVIWPHLEKFYSWPIIATSIIFNGLHVTPFLFDVSNDWLNLNSYLYYHLQWGTNDQWLLATCIFHIFAALCIAHVQPHIHSPPEPVHLKSHIKVTLPYYICIIVILGLWLSPLLKMFYQVLGPDIGYFANLSWKIPHVFEAFRNTIILSSVGTLFGYMGIISATTFCIRNPWFEKIFSLLSVALIILPLFLITLFNLQGISNYFILLCAHTVIIFGWGWRYCTAEIYNLIQKYSPIAQAYKTTYSKIYQGAVRTHLHPVLFYLTPIILGISLGEVMIVSSLSTNEIVTIPKLILLSMQSYKFTQANIITFLFIVFFYFICLLIHTGKNKYAQTTQS